MPIGIASPSTPSYPGGAPRDIWQMRSNIREGVVFRNPRSEGERFQVAVSCVRTLGIRFPALIDGMDNTVEQAYTGWPDRLY